MAVRERLVFEANSVRVTARQGSEAETPVRAAADTELFEGGLGGSPLNPDRDLGTRDRLTIRIYYAAVDLHCALHPDGHIVRCGDNRCNARELALDVNRYNSRRRITPFQVRAIDDESALRIG